jgi:hypothetical protein
LRKSERFPKSDHGGGWFNFPAFTYSFSSLLAPEEFGPDKTRNKIKWKNSSSSLFRLTVFDGKWAIRECLMAEGKLLIGFESDFLVSAVLWSFRGEKKLYMSGEVLTADRCC